MLFPTTDIHLIQTDGVHGGPKLVINVFTTNLERLSVIPTATIENSSVTATLYNPVAAARGNNPAHCRIESVAPGVTKIRLNSGNDQNMVRVCAHTRLTKHWLENDQVTLYEKESNYVLSTFAEFEDVVGETTYQSIADISTHDGYYKDILVGAVTETVYIPYVSYVLHDTQQVKILNKPGLNQHLFATLQTVNPVDVGVFINYASDAILRLIPVVSGAIVVGDLTILSGGSGYTVADPPEVRVIRGTGSGAAVKPTIVSGAVTGFTLVSGGTGYTAREALKVVIVRDQLSDAKATATIVAVFASFCIY